MSLKTVYQTLKFKDNNDEVLKHGPYCCNEKNAWLHYGYYFWEEFTDPAHHWGKTWCSNKYIITCGECIIYEESLFDLVGNLQHIKEMKETVQHLEEEGLVNNQTTVAHVIDFLKKMNEFDYVATRANTTESFGKNYPHMQLQYEYEKNTMLTLNPAVQICIYDLDKAVFSDFRIFYQSIASI